MSAVICFMGPDGSGKTTLVKLIQKGLIQKGYRVKYVWFRFPRLLTFVLLFSAKHLGFTQYVDKSKSRIALHNLSRQPFRTLYPLVVLLDTLSFYFLRISIPSKLGCIILCDRCIFDIIIDLAIETNNYKFHCTTLGYLFYKIASHAKATFLIDAPDETLNARRPETSLDPYTPIRRSLYRRFAETYDLNVICTINKVSSTYNLLEDYFEREIYSVK